MDIPKLYQNFISSFTKINFYNFKNLLTFLKFDFLGSWKYLLYLFMFTFVIQFILYFFILFEYFFEVLKLIFRILKFCFKFLIFNNLILISKLFKKKSSNKINHVPQDLDKILNLKISKILSQQLDKKLSEKRNQK